MATEIFEAIWQEWISKGTVCKLFGISATVHLQQDWESVENDASLLVDCLWENFLNKSREHFIIRNYEFWQFSQKPSVTFSIFYKKVEAAGKLSLFRMHKLKTEGYQAEE